MILRELLVLAGLAETAIQAIANIVGVHQMEEPLTPEQITSIKGAMNQAEEDWQGS